MHRSSISPSFILPIAAGLLLYGSAIALILIIAGSAQAAQPAKGAAATPSMGDRCINIPARAAARLAYLETRLELTTAQSPLFTRWKDVKLTAAKQMEARCDTFFKNDGAAQRAASSNSLSPVDRLARTEDRLQQRLTDIRAERPALTALYASLNDEQKAKFGHAGQRGMRRGAKMRRMHAPMKGTMHPPFDRRAPDGQNNPAPAPAP